MHVEDDYQEVTKMNKSYLSHSSHIDSHRKYLRMCNGQGMDFASSSSSLSLPRVHSIIQLQKKCRKNKTTLV